MPPPHYRMYFPLLQAFQGGGTASKDASYLPRFGAIDGYRHWAKCPVLQLPSELCMRPGETVAKRPFSSTFLVLSYYT